MHAPIKTQLEWKLKWAHGDIDLIVAASITPEKPEGISRRTISRALATGHMHPETFDAINRYYNKKDSKFKAQNDIDGN